jgi:aminopeptidase N
MRRLFLFLLVCLCAACTVVPPQPIVPAATSTSAPTLAPAAVSAPAIDRSSPVDLAPYRAAMKPAFATEVDRFGAASQYQIDLTIAPDLSSYSATQRVRYTNTETEPLKEIYFSLFAHLPSYGGELKVVSVALDGQPVAPQFEQGDVLMKIDLPKSLPPGETINLELTYSAEVPVKDVEEGYNQFGLHKNVLTLPNFYPQIPVYDDEGWNITLGPGYGDAVFSDTALYQVNITAPADQVIATSGVCEAQAAPAGRQVQRCVSGPMRDFMIAMSSDYRVKSDRVEGATINSYFVKGHEEASARGLEVASEALKFYTRRFGSYPFTELDLIETSTTAAGIEYPGLIVVTDRYFKAPGSLEGVTAHEVAHQWWYSLVGNDQVDDPWLDEALTQFSMCLYYRDVYGPEGLSGCVEQALQSRYERVQGTDEDRRADLPVSGYSDREYGAIVYGKAPLFFNAIYEAIGDEKFNHLLQDYFSQYRYGVAYPQDFLKIAEEYVGQTKLAEMLQEWIETP